METDILIVGAGFAGAATAYHLRCMSDLRVTIVEKEPVVGMHSSGRNAAMIRESMTDSTLQPLATEGADRLRDGDLAEFNPCGSVLIGLGDDDLTTHFPLVHGKGLWCPKDGVIDVAALLNSYMENQTVYCNTRVVDWRQTADCVEVETTRRSFKCNVLVNATGPWAGEFGKLPLTPMNRHLFVTTPLKHIDPDWPFVWDVTNGLYFRPESGGLLLSACDESTGTPGVYTEDERVLHELATKLSRLQPELADVPIQSQWVGQRVFAPDHRFVIGFDPRCDRLFHVAALGGHGVTTSYAVGKHAADSIIFRRRTTPDPFSPARLT